MVKFLRKPKQGVDVKKISLLLLLPALALFVFVLLPHKTRNRSDDLIVGTNTEFVPFSYIENGEIVGFDIDVAKEVCRRLGKRCVFKDMPFDALIPDLSYGNVDFIAAGMSWTEERAKRVSFTRPYLSHDPLVIFSLTSQNVTTLDGLRGKNVIVNEGYTADLFLTERGDLNLIRLSAPADAFLGIMNGRAEAFVTAESTVTSFLENQDPAMFRYNPIEGVDENCAIVVSKNKSELLAAIQGALDSMERDGTMAKLKRKWKLP